MDSVSDFESGGCGFESRRGWSRLESVDDVAEWSNLFGGTLGAGFRHQSSGVGSNPTIIMVLPQLTNWRNGSASDSRPEGYVFESRMGQFAVDRRVHAPEP